MKNEACSLLPTNVVPSHYHLTILPEISEFTFSGTETIKVQVRERTKTIVLNSLDIAIQSASFLSKNQDRRNGSDKKKVSSSAMVPVVKLACWSFRKDQFPEVYVPTVFENYVADIQIDEQSSVKIELDKGDETAVITFANELEIGAGQLKLEFTGLINDMQIGCYRSEYEDSKFLKHQGLATNFESSNCRRAFPCWDEPVFKAKFDLTLIAPKDRVALSNMPVIKETDDPVDSTKRVLKFATTPIMNTYALAFIIGQYEYIEEQANGVVVRMYTAPGKSKLVLSALKTAIRFLNFFVSYPLPKLDLVAFTDILGNKIETWGLITCYDFTILGNPSKNSRFVREMVTTFVFASLSSQWFGNLVTKDSSKNSWINDASTRFISLLIDDHFQPESCTLETFITKYLTSTLRLDALQYSHPIEMNKPNEVFDEISHHKGASVLRMLYYHLGDEAYKKGVSIYLSKWAHENVITEDLWGSLEEVSKKPVRSFVSTWIQQKGYPLIHVTSRQDGSNRVLTLTQEKFSVHGDQLSENADRQSKWSIPIRIISQSNKKPVKILLESQSQEVVLMRVQPNEWVKLNRGMTAFCRVNYSPDMLQLLQPGIVDKSLSSIDRLNIQDDLFALVQSGKVSSDRFLELIESYKLEDRYSVWESIIDCLGKFNSILEYTDFQALFHLYARKLLVPIRSKLDNHRVSDEHELYDDEEYDDEEEENADLKNLVCDFLMSCKDSRALQETKAEFDPYFGMIGESPSDPNFLVINGGFDEKTFESCFKLYRKGDKLMLEKRIFQFLSVSRDPIQISKLIEFAMSAEVRSEDAIHAFASIAAHNKIGREIAWNYYKENYQLFNEKFKSEALLCRLVKNLTENFASEDRLKDVKAHFMAHPVVCAERTVQQALELIQVNASWLSRDSQIIKNYLVRSSEL